MIVVCSERMLVQALLQKPLWLGGTLRLNAGYSGPILQIWDGTNTYDVCSVNAIPALCGSNNGFVAKVYDQSGNGRDMSQATTTRRPKIYDGASTSLLRTIARGPCVMRFDGVDDYLTRADGCGLTGAPSLTVWQLAKVSNFPQRVGYTHWGTSGTTGGEFATDYWTNHFTSGQDVPRVTSQATAEILYSDTITTGHTSLNFHDDVVTWLGGVLNDVRTTWTLNNTAFPQAIISGGTPNLNNLGSGIGAKSGGTQPLNGDLAAIGLWSPTLSTADKAQLIRFGQAWRLP